MLIRNFNHREDGLTTPHASVGACYYIDNTCFHHVIFGYEFRMIAAVQIISIRSPSLNHCPNLRSLVHNNEHAKQVVESLNSSARQYTRQQASSASLGDCCSAPSSRPLHFFLPISQRFRIFFLACPSAGFSPCYVAHHHLFLSTHTDSSSSNEDLPSSRRPARAAAYSRHFSHAGSPKDGLGACQS